MSSGVSVHHSGQFSTMSADIGEIRRVQMHVGVCDKTAYADIHCQHGRLSMDADTLRSIVRQGTEALATGRWFNTDVSGSATDLGEM